MQVKKFLNRRKLINAFEDSGWSIKHFEEFIIAKIINEHSDGRHEYINLAIELPNFSTDKHLKHLSQIVVVSPKDKDVYRESSILKKGSHVTNKHFWLNCTCDEILKLNYSEDAFCITRDNDIRFIEWLNELNRSGEEDKIVKIVYSLIMSYMKQFFHFRHTGKWLSELQHTKHLSKKDIEKMKKEIK